MVRILIMATAISLVLISCGGNNSSNNYNWEDQQNQEYNEKQAREERRQEEERRVAEEQERTMRSFVGTYTIKDCKVFNVSTTHVPKTFLTIEEDVRTYKGYTTWDLEIVVRDDYSVYTREVNIREYNENDRLVSTTESRGQLEAGVLDVISENLCSISSRSNFTFTEYAQGFFHRARTKKNEPMETGIKLTSSLIIDKSTNRIYESYRDYKRKDENEGYDWVGYPFTTFTFRK